MICMYNDTLSPRSAAQKNVMITGLSPVFETYFLRSLTVLFDERAEFIGNGPGKLEQHQFNVKLADKCQSTFSSSLVRLHSLTK